MNNKKLKKARNRIDKIDNKIFNLIKKRTYIVKHMLSLKEFKNQIIDKKRINEIIKKIRKKSLKDKIDPKITTRIWKTMIWSYVDYQKRNFNKKSHHLKNSDPSNGHIEMVHLNAPQTATYSWQILIPKSISYTV